MAEDTPPRELLENLVERIDHLERILQAQTARLYAVEQRLGLEPRPLGIDAAQRPEPAPQAQGQAAPNDNAAASHTPPGAGPRYAEAQQEQQPPRGAWGGFAYEPHRAEQSAPNARQSAPQPPRPAPHAAAPKRDIESRGGGSIFAWSGIHAGVLAVGFFLKLAFDSQW